eukprot:717303-Prymnesium_polylepis.1
MVLGAEDGCNHPQPTGSSHPLICGWVACFWAFWGLWDACIKRNVTTTLRDPPSLATRRRLVFTSYGTAHFLSLKPVETKKTKHASVRSRVFLKHESFAYRDLYHLQEHRLASARSH